MNHVSRAITLTTPGNPLARSLRSHLLVLVSLALLPALVIAIVTDVVLAARNRDAFNSRVTSKAQSFAVEIDQQVATIGILLESLAQAPDLDLTGETASFYARSVTVAGRLQTQIALTRLDGTRVFNTMDVPYSFEPFPITPKQVEQLILTRQPVMTDVVMRNTKPTPRALLMVPVLRGNEVVAALRIGILPEILYGELSRQNLADGALVMVTDATGRIAATRPERPDLTGRLLSEVSTQSLQRSSGRKTAATVPAEQPELNLSTRQIGDQSFATLQINLANAAGWSVHYGEDSDGVDPSLLNPMFATIAALLLAGCASLHVAALLADRLVGPLQYITRKADMLAFGNEVPFEALVPSTVTEFESLRLSIMQSGDSLRRRSLAERMALRDARMGKDILTSIINATADGIAVKDLNLRYLMVNQAGLRFRKPFLTEEQVLGRTALELGPVDVAAMIERVDRAVLAKGEAISFEQKYQLPGSETNQTGETRWYEMTITPWKDVSGRIAGVVSVTRDITEQRRVSERLRTLQADLLRATRLSTMGAMASGLAHEINQPLAAATNYLNASARLLERGLKIDESEITIRNALMSGHAAVLDAAQQTLRIGDIVRRLRDFISRGETELEPACIVELVRDTCDLARSDGLPDFIDLRMYVAQKEGGHLAPVLVDRTQLQQVLLNLIRNASEALMSHGARSADGTLGALGIPGHSGAIIILIARPDANDAEAAEGIAITVSDNGPGLDPEIVDRVFHPFISTKPTGMGIGLAICRSIVEGHGGTLSASSRVQPGSGDHAASEDDDGRGAEQGACFRIWLPTSPAAGEA
jgi:two-component system sensor kinase FixL